MIDMRAIIIMRAILKEKNTGRHISQKVVFITIEIKIIVQKP